MTEQQVWGTTLPEAYHHALMHLRYCGEVYPCPEWDTQVRECSLVMIVQRPLQEPRISRCTICGPRELEQYRQEMLDGILDFEVERGNWSYTYHQRMGDQVDFVVRELQRDPWSRRAVIDIRRPEDAQSREPPCLQHLQYLLRDGKLSCIATFRSNDACKAMYMNAFALICLQERIAEKLGVPVGNYIHRANSLHAYQRDWPLLESYLKARGRDATYNYEGHWDELMAEEREDIAAAVERLRERGAEE